MNSITRRSFLKGTVAAGITIAAPYNITHSKPNSKILGSNDEVGIAVVGLRGKGAHHLELFRNVPNVRVRAICDVDQVILDREKKKFTDRNEKVKTYSEYRKLLEDKDIDAVVIATPNHWHSLQGIWACQAGKDIYVEKPVSHNVWEGNQLVKAARKYKRIVQAGTQSRSDEALHEVFDYIQQGNLGKIVVAHGFCYKKRNSIGKVNGPQPIPKSIDYNLWTGPASIGPLRRSRVHYDWHWEWETGNGDLGNQGIHQMDMCRWALNKNELPRQIMSIGGRFGYDDDGNTANSQITILDYESAPIIFEVRGLPRRIKDTAMDNYKGVRVGVVIKCENGYFAGGAGGGWIYDNNGERIKKFSSAGGGGHQANFIDAVRSRKVDDLNADIQEGHVSSALCHLANISYRVGTLSTTEEINKALNVQPIAHDVYRSYQDHLLANWVDITVDKSTLGPWLQVDPKNEKFLGESEYNITRWANDLLKRNYREPFVVPDRV